MREGRCQKPERIRVFSESHDTSATSGYVLQSYSKFTRYRAYRRILCFALFVCCLRLAECTPRVLRQTIERPGHMERATVNNAGRNSSPGLRGFKEQGFSEVDPGYASSGFGAMQPKPGPTSLRDFLQQIQVLRGNMIEMQRHQSRGGLGFDDDTSLPTQNWRQPTLPVGGLGPRVSGIGKPPKQDPGRMFRGPTQRRSGSSFKDGAETKIPEGKNGTGGNEAQKLGSSAWMKECLDVHNEYRARHRAPPLKMTTKLNQSSQRYANHLAATSKSVYDLKHSHWGYGENLTSCTGYEVTGRLAVDQWYEEINNYDFNTGTSTNGKKIGHLTQLLWETSREMGVGVAVSSEGVTYVVCQYDPPGNVGNIDQNPRYVPPLGGFTQEDRKRHAQEDAAKARRLQQALYDNIPPWTMSRL